MVQTDLKVQGLNSDTVVPDKNKKEIEVSIDKNKKQVEKESGTKDPQNNSKDTDKNKSEEVKAKTEKKVNEKQAHKDAIVPKLLDNNNKTTKSNNKKETNEEITRWKNQREIASRFFFHRTTSRRNHLPANCIRGYCARVDFSLLRRC